jgi:adenylate kinase
VTYTRANTRSVYRKSVDEVADLLQNLNSPAAMADRERLASLDRRITHLALVTATDTHSKIKTGSGALPSCPTRVSV